MPTAGGGGSGGDDHDPDHADRDLHVAYFRGVENAESIRETIRERLKRHIDSGLGDPDDVDRRMLPAAPAHESLLAAVRALATEAGALRAAMTK